MRGALLSFKREHYAKQIAEIRDTRGRLVPYQLTPVRFHFEAVRGAPSITSAPRPIKGLLHENARSLSPLGIPTQMSHRKNASFKFGPAMIARARVEEMCNLLARIRSSPDRRRPFCSRIEA